MAGTDINKWADTSMFTAEKSTASEGVKVFLLGAPADPLGQIAAAAKMYKGEVVRDLADVTDDERREYLEQIQKTVLKMPLEAVPLHFMVEGVTRGFTHQMVRQRTAAYAQESMRFAVKEDAAEAVALPPSLDGTKDRAGVLSDIAAINSEAGLSYDGSPRPYITEEDFARLPKEQQWRLHWDEAVKKVSDVYNSLVNSGMPAEDARGLLPTSITTRLNYITNLRSWYDTMAVRVSDQAQFEWRGVAMHMALAMRAYGAAQSYWTTLSRSEYVNWDDRHPSNPILERRFLQTEDGNAMDASRAQVRLSSEWQYVALTNELKPIEFKIGGPAFGANFDRPSRIGERVRAFHSRGVPSSEWTKGSVEHGIPPIHPEEWLLDPNSARLSSGMEFDIFGNRVAGGSGWHWLDGDMFRNTNGNQTDGYDRAVWPNDFKEAQA